MGAALIGGVGIGLYPDFSMIEKMNQTAAIIEPDPKAQAAYDRISPIFDAAYDALVPVFKLLSS